MDDSTSEVLADLSDRVLQWLSAEGDAKSTSAGAIAILDKLDQKSPRVHAEMFTQAGSLRDARGGALRASLEKFGFPEGLLRDGVTTRSMAKFQRFYEETLDRGDALASLEDDQRHRVVAQLAALVLQHALAALNKKPLKIGFDRRDGATTWVEQILESSKDRSRGRVEQHLVGGKLEARFPDGSIPRDRAHAADMQTNRSGDFPLGDFALHVTSGPGQSVITRCKDNLQHGVRPVLLVLRNQVERTKGLIEGAGIGGQVDVLAMEDFIAANIIELAIGRGVPLFEALEQVIAAYNDRVETVEGDPTLRIDPS